MAKIDYSRAEVIEVLEYLLSPVCTETQFDYCDEIRAAIALLEEQEARVMTLEEWKNLPEPQDGECLCYEIDDGSLQAMLTKVFTGSERLYGKAFRVWTSRPSPEQMSNTPWEGGEGDGE